MVQAPVEWLTLESLYCLQNGSEMGWLVDSEDSFIFVYDAEGRVQAFEQLESELPVPAFATDVKLMSN